MEFSSRWWLFRINLVGRHELVRCRPAPPTLSGVGSDRTRPNRLDLWNLNGSDPIHASSPATTSQSQTKKKNSSLSPDWRSLFQIHPEGFIASLAHPPGPCWRQRGSRYTIRAGRYLCARGSSGVIERPSPPFQPRTLWVLTGQPGRERGGNGLPKKPGAFSLRASSSFFNLASSIYSHLWLATNSMKARTTLPFARVRTRWIDIQFHQWQRQLEGKEEDGLEPYGTDSRGGCLEGETLRAFIAHFNKLVMEIKDLQPDVVVEALKSSIMDKKLIYSITKMPPRNLIDMLHRCERHAAANDVVDMATEREKGAKASNKTRSDQPDKSIKTGVKNKKPKSEKETIGKIG
ncbi:hypothetical protein NE237_022914 [Protea cynaroides]|uniref:Retrotransposon gag domain-containing protein n=1 Tax=Protea cynaroides TaxID=273540 RepID=A0A9Q0K5Q0_9MAGN|nr:hypothetical protein NE237_022914 [Protea cynaroides]